MTERADHRAAFLERRPYSLDPFQLEAIEALDNGDSVLVVAPTGSGKTVVGEYAIDVARNEGGRAFYTTPLKALSNQKYTELIEIYGPESVGLLTGDNVVNAEAPSVVMTTEVLRNMIYANSPVLSDLRYVVLDEVHYLQNTYRGPVWEEVIIHLPRSVGLVCLSATVSNAEELASWIRTVRGSTVPVISEKRPVELTHHYAVTTKRNTVTMLPTFTAQGRPNPRCLQYDQGSNRRNPWAGRNNKGSVRAPDRVDMVAHLRNHSMLPAIYFIFSRNACNDAVAQCLNENLRLTSPAERERITQIAEEEVESLTDEDLRVLGYGEWVAALENGVASHHAGMVTPFRRAVERCFNEALVKVVFATETLALGINMPARSVVVEKMSKFTGERHETLTPGEYTQLIGRAGRRGIDDRGNAIAMWSRWTPFEKVAQLASTKTYQLRSSFRPTYNMAVNLVRRYPPDVARHLLNLSFAQYQSDTDVVRVETRVQTVVEAIERAKQRAYCERLDAAPNDDGPQASELTLGDAIADPDDGKPLLVIATSERKGGDVKIGVITKDARRFNLTGRDFDGKPRMIGHFDLPSPYNPTNRDFIRRAAASLDELETDTEAADDGTARTCPDRQVHLTALRELERLTTEKATLEKNVKTRSESLARQFDRVLDLLTELGYVDDWRLQAPGRALAHTYHESDLFIVECARLGIFDGLKPAELAALVSVFTFESRGPAGSNDAPVLRTKRLAERVAAVEQTWARLAGQEQARNLPLTRAPDAGFCDLAHGWVSGGDLSDVLDDDSPVSGGDFVRNMRQLIDLLAQLPQVVKDPETAACARMAADALDRDVIAAAAVVTVPGTHLDADTSENIEISPPESA